MKGLVIGAGAALWLAGCGEAAPRAARAEPAETSRAPAGATAAAAPAATCRVEGTGRPLPGEVRESSGLARSARDPDLFWTHNDAGNSPVLFGVDAEGRLAQRVTVRGAAPTDWESLDAGPCEGGDCLYLGDIGDNDAERERITVYRIREPAPGASEAGAEPLHARYPDGARDAEGLFALPSGELFVVTKGRRGPIDLYRYPPPRAPGETVTLEHVRELFPEPEDSDDRVTGAAATPDGRWVAVRSYRTLYLYRANDLLGGGPAEPAVVDLGPLDEEQGESVAVGSDGTVWVTSEAGGKNDPPRWARFQCTLPAR